MSVILSAGGEGDRPSFSSRQDEAVEIAAARVLAVTARRRPHRARDSPVVAVAGRGRCGIGLGPRGCRLQSIALNCAAICSAERGSRSAGICETSSAVPSRAASRRTRSHLARHDVRVYLPPARSRLALVEPQAGLYAPWQA